MKKYNKVQIMEKLDKLARKVDDLYLALYDKTNNDAYSEDLISTKLYQAVHEYCSRDLDLENYYNWGLEDMGEFTRGSFTGYSVKINRLNKPAAYLMSGLYSEGEVRVKYYNKALNVLSTMAHELRHAYQQEHGLADLDSYIDSEEDFDAYINQPCEVDAREYQAGFFTEEMYDEFFKFLK